MSEATTQIKAYCLKCKTKKIVLDGKRVVWKNGSHAFTGKCECGCTIQVVIPKPKPTTFE